LRQKRCTERLRPPRSTCEVSLHIARAVMALFATFCLLESAAPAAIVMPPVVAGAAVRTLAGNGESGNLDGPGTRATFMFPVALARDERSGATFVLDRAGQRVRRISADGSVTTVAGGGAPLASGLSVAGAYADGPALAARFDAPQGIALAPDGTLYVADTGNRCIRRIAGGRVTTYAGSPARGGWRDGPAGQASFRDPRGLSFDSDGTLYVADFGAGVRAIAPDGRVRTLPLPRQWGKTVGDLSVWDRGPHHMLFGTSNAGFWRYNIEFAKIDGVVEAERQIRFAGYGVVALSEQTAALSSPLWQGVYFVHYGGTWRRIAGQGGQDPTLLGGFADGTPADARFYAPLGLALDARGDILVADAGNRRVRSVPAVNTRWTEDYGTAPPPRKPDKYHVFFLSNSFSFENVVWDDSIAGLVEKRLNAEREKIGLPKPVEFEVAYFAAAPLVAETEYVEQSLAAGTVDLVVWNLNTHFFHDDFLDWETALPEFTPANEARWKAALERANRALTASKTQLLLLDEPLGTHLGPQEGSAFRDAVVYEKSNHKGYDVGYGKYGQILGTPGYGYDVNVALERFLASTGIPYAPTYDKLLAYERGPHVPLYSNIDFHLTPAGDAFVADVLASYLESARPWLHAAPPK
jgi:hypothetical protein